MLHYSFDNNEFDPVLVPKLGLGTWDLRGSTATTIVQQALDIGYRHIDTAQMYGNESEIGQAIQSSTIDRSEIFLTTKIGPRDLAPATFRKCLEESLKRLKTEYVDLLLIHWPNPSIPLEETLACMMELQHEKKVNLIGVSNFTIVMVDRALKTGAHLFTNQIEYHPFLNQDKLLFELGKHEMSLTAYCPIARAKVIGHPTFVEIARKYGKNEIQIALRWIMDQELALAIPRTSNPKNLLSNFDIFDFELTRGEHMKIDQLKHQHMRLVNSPFSPDWDQP